MQDTATRLDELARLLADMALTGPEPPPTFVAVRGLAGPDGDVIFSTIDDAHPTLALLDIPADRSWEAVGLIAPGTAHPMPGASLTAPAQVQVVSLLDRAGRLAGSVRGAGMEPIDESPRAGIAVDALHRLLDLPTPPPPPDTSEVWSVIWAKALLWESCRRSLRWRSAAALHPAARFCDGGSRQAHHDLPDAVARLVAFADWPWLHDFASRREPLEAMGLTSARAARLDLGAFARLLLWTLPPLDNLLAQCDDALPPGLARRVREVAEAH